MKYIKLCIASLLLMSMSAFAQNGRFITDQPSLYVLPDGAKYVNPRGDLLLVDENPAAKTIAFTYQDASTENWVFSSSADYNAVLDRFVTGARSQGNDFYYTNFYGSNAHRRIPYTAVRKVSCAITQPGGGAFYTATITLTSGMVIVSNGYSSDFCQFFN